MNRSYIGRVVGIFVVAAGMLLGLFAATASAQVVDRAPASQIQASAAGAGPIKGHLAVAPNAAGVGAAYTCGYQRDPQRGWDAFYVKCERSTFPRIRVQFNYWNTRDITIVGSTNLSRHRDLQGAGAITGAWCIRDCW